MNKTFLSALTAVLPMLLVPAVLYSTESNSIRLDMEDGVVAGWGSTDVRYPEKLSRSGVSGQHKSDFSSDDAFSLDKEISLKAWRGESVSAQIVVVTGAEGALDSLHAEVQDFPCGVRTGFVGYVMTDELNRDGSGGCGYRRNADFDSSYVADPIDHLTGAKAVAENSVQPLWLTVDVPRDIPAGKYDGLVRICDGSRELSSLRLTLEVSGRTLPEENDFHLDLWQNPYAVARYYGVGPFSEAHFDMMRPIMQLYADAGGKVITASITHKPWDGQTYDPFESMVTWMRKADGTWLFDYTVFDMWVEFMMSLGVDSQINCYSMIPWRLSFQYFDQASNSLKFLDTVPGEAEYEEFWTRMLKSFAAHLREKGWFDITMIAMDERPMDRMLAAVEVIKNADPDFRIAFEGNCHEELLDALDYYCIPIWDNYPEGAVEKRREEGKITAWYTCCTESWSNTFTFSYPAEAEWIGWYVAANGLDGYLRWAFNSWPEDPMRDSRFTAWAAGDTYLVYPGGLSSIRFERLKAGITAYRKIMALREEFTRTGNRSGLARLEKALSLFRLPDADAVRQHVLDKDMPDFAADAVNAAKKILDRY